MKLIYPAYFKQGYDNRYRVTIPDLDITQRTDTSNMYRAMEMVVHDVSLFIIREFGEVSNAPKPTSIRDMDESDDLGRLAYIVVDLDDFATKYSRRSVKKTLTIPSWLNVMAEEKNLNFSHVLQKALKDELNRHEPPKVEHDKLRCSEYNLHDRRFREKTYEIRT